MDTLSRIDLSILSVNFSYVCFIYSEIFEKMSSGGLEVSHSIDLLGSYNISQAFIRYFFLLTNHIVFGDFSAKFKCVSIFHIRKDIRPGVRAALGYSPKCISSITNFRNILVFLISQNLVNCRENAYGYQRISGDHHCDLLANYRSDM